MPTSYLASLELAANAEVRVQEEFARNLDRGSRMVEDYQMQTVDVLNGTLAVAQDKAKAYNALKSERDALKFEPHECKLASANKLVEAEYTAHEADRTAAVELRKIEQEIGRLQEELAKISPFGEI